MPASPDPRENDAAFALIVECLRPAERFDLARAGTLLAASGNAALLRMAEHHGVSAGLFGPVARLPGVDAAMLETLRGEHEAALRHHLQIIWELARLREVLDGAGVRWAVVKGPAAAELLYDDPGMRGYGDLDVLVDPARFPDTLEALRAAGHRVLDRNWRAIRRELRGELHVETPDGSLLDLHWNLVNIYRGRIRLDTAAMLGRVQHVDLGGVVAPTLEPTDALLHLALHGTLSGGDRLRWVRDVAQASARRPPDWDALATRALAWRAAAPVGYLLQRALTILQAPVPPKVPARLLGGGYGALVRGVDRLTPWHRSGGRLTSPALAITRSMGYSLPGAAGWLIRRAFRSLDPREPRASSSFRLAGGPADYEAFLAAVVASAVGRRR